MRLAFYAPMKPPDHPVPSGDRTIAKALLTALAALGADVDLASRLRSREPKGDTGAQQALIAEAAAETACVVAKGRAAGWEAWITYHNYYKAPDLIGPAVCRALGIPYLQIEATRARKRLQGPWAAFAEAAEAATDAAQVVFYFTRRDAETLRRDAPQGQRLVHLAPFLTEEAGAPKGPLPATLLAVGMMRQGDKLASYRLIAETLALLRDENWQLIIAGDGPARAEVAALMRPFGARVRFAGALDRAGLAGVMQQAGILFWPGVNEAVGMVYLEAQSAGLAVVAQDRPGLREVLAPGDYPSVEDGPAALAGRIGLLTRDATARAAAGEQARAYVQQHHLLPQAVETLAAGLARVGVRP